MSESIVRLDVRPILASGRDPFSEIMAVASGVPQGGRLIVVAPFNPAPLREVLGTSGFRSEALQAATGEWEVTFCRDAQPAAPNPPQAQKVRFWSAGGEDHVDARGLDEAGAVRVVLAAAGRLDGSRKLIARLDANIDRLYPQLARLGWEPVFVPGDAGEVRLEISRAA